MTERDEAQAAANESQAAAKALRREKTGLEASLRARTAEMAYLRDEAIAA